MVEVADPLALGLTFVFVVPGDQQWMPRSFRASSLRAAGGAPQRAYTLTITDGTNIVAAVAAADAGSEPGTCEVTWTNTPASVVASGSQGVSVAPIANFVLKSGYVITGEIINPAAGDVWLDAVCWTDFVYTHN